VLPVLIWFVVRGGRAVVQRLGDGLAGRGASLILPLGIAFAWLSPPIAGSYFGVQASASHQRSTHVGRRPDVVREAREAGLDNALVFVRESWHGALAARLRALGAPPLLAQRFIPSVDACALQHALDSLPSSARGFALVEQVLQEAYDAGDPQPVIGREGRPDLSLSLVRGRPLSERCQRELALDRSPTVPYALLLAHADIAPDGRIGGRVVFARDLGTRDTLLLERFADRRWYRYAIEPGEIRGRFVPLEPRDKIGSPAPAHTTTGRSER
jgi:hypothetical protein